MAFRNMKANEAEIARIKEARTIGYWSCMGGVEVKFVEDGPDYTTYIKGVMGTFAGTPKVFQRAVQYTNNAEPREYIVINHTRLYLDECIRTDI